MMEKETDRDDRKTERVLFLWDRLSRGGMISRQDLVEIGRASCRERV